MCHPRNVDSILTYLESLPPVALYIALGLAAAMENVLPPLPTDSVVAFGGFLAARGQASALGIFLATWTGNVAGACAVYAVFRRVGWGQHRLMRESGRWSAARLRALYDRYGLVALALSRFVPGARALVPPLAGSLRVAAPGFVGVLALASAVWYGVLTSVAYTAGANWETVQSRIVAMADGWTLAAAGIVAALVIWWWLARRRA